MGACSCWGYIVACSRQESTSPGGKENEKFPPGGQRPCGCSGQWSMDRPGLCAMPMSRSRERGREGECASLFPWGYISLGVGETRRFLKMTNQFPKLLCASGGSSSQPICSFSRLCQQASLVQDLPLCHFDFYGTCAYLPLVPCPICYQRAGARAGARSLCLSSYLASFLYTQCKKNPPLLPSWLMEETPLCSH